MFGVMVNRGKTCIMLPKRRNGQLSSCEPCRKAKLRCDHATPTCGRCAEKQQIERCIYHPAPLTRPKSLEKLSTIRKKRKRKCPAVREKDTTSTDLLSRYRVQPSPTANREVSSNTEDISQLKRDVFSIGFLGPSSYWAPFHRPDDDQTLAINPEASPREDLGTPLEASMKSDLVEWEQIECGARVLALLDDLPLYQQLLSARFQLCQPWVFGIRIAAEIFHQLTELRKQWIRGTKNKKSQTRMLALSKTIFDNSASSINMDRCMTVSQYFSVATVRWDTIALMFTWVGIAATVIPDSHECLRQDDGTSIDRSKLRMLMVKVVELCLSFCDSVGAMSDPLCWALLQHTTLLADSHGDSNYRTWRRLGDLSTMIFALGIHCPEKNPNIPFFLIEMRKRIMIASYAVDKMLATLLGRPPRITWQYCDIQHPLDLDYDEIFAASDERRQDDLLEKLGPEGWNIEGRITSGSQARLYALFGPIREKILALSLSPHPEDVGQRVSEAWAEHKQLRLNLPHFLQWSPSLIDGVGTMNYNTEFLANVHLEILNNEFILHHVLVKKTGQGKPEFLKLAREMLSTLLFVFSRCPLHQKQVQQAWNLCYLGLPCAGALTRELLERSQHQRHHKHIFDGKQQPPENTIPFPRSEVIQNLSVFASYLESGLDVHHGNYGIARKGLHAIRSVLDRILSDGDEISSNAGAHADATAQRVTPDMRSVAAVPRSWSPTLPDVYSEGWNEEFMTWLDNIDWAQESLITFS